jgi:hypothetical protein
MPTHPKEPWASQDTIQGMRRAGRVSPLFLALVLGVAAVIAVLMFGQEGPAAAASRFMTALAQGNATELTKNSFVSGKSPEELQKDWEFTTKYPGKHYLFRWNITSSRVVDDRTADVKLQVERNFGPGSYEENYGLSLTKVDGAWKVDAGAINREMYPGLPRAGKG